MRSNIEVTFYSTFSVNICTGHIVHQNGFSYEGDTGVSETIQTLKYIVKTVRSIETVKGLLDGGTVAIW